ncbi:hypothetical protein SUGI_0388150 [Cryptomeria japonica]|nr:hypothetical protein SUGI_0388150 [Cryptomeria japonica]
MISAGTDTAARTVEWAMPELIRHPHLIKKVRDEVDACVGMEEMVTESHLSQLKYLQVVVSETLRLQSPTPLMLPHASPDSSRVIFSNNTVRFMHLIGHFALVKNPKIGEVSIHRKDPLTLFATPRLPNHLYNS